MSPNCAPGSRPGRVVGGREGGSPVGRWSRAHRPAVSPPCKFLVKNFPADRLPASVKTFTVKFFTPKNYTNPRRPDKLKRWIPRLHRASRRSDMTRLCSDCTHAVTERKSAAYPRCSHSKCQDGRVMHFCSTVRQRYGQCGPMGQFFEPRRATYDPGSA
jgi:hypothetical protein